MINIFTKIGAFALVAALLLWVIQDQKPELSLSVAIEVLAYGGAIALAIGICRWLFVFVLFEAKKAGGSRCVRCGKPVARGMSYCPKHLKDVAQEITHSQGK
jgi:hypothetical protein